MSTDLSGILKDEGVECPELDAYLAIDYEFLDKQWWEITDDAHDALLALVRLVVKYKRMHEAAHAQHYRAHREKR